MSWRQNCVFVIAFVLCLGDGAMAEESHKEDCQKAIDNLSVSSETKDQSSVESGEGTAEAQRTIDSASPTATDKPANDVGDENQTPMPFKYVGNKFSSKFHRPSCPFAKAISSGHLIFFEHRHDAIDQGFQPCRYCLPPDWKTVHAVILPNVKPVANAAEGSKKEQ
jgi:Metal binding domain of Ada